LIAETCTGYVIDAVDTVVDTIVFDGADNDEFANEIRGRTVTGCERKGKQ
jgi:formamidopyrimidine-DNA glycosylase